MADLISFLMVGLSLVLALPVAVLLTEVIFAIAVNRQKASRISRAPVDRVAVLIPAHNEGSNLAPTVTDIRCQLRPGDRLLVVADNCSDDTAAKAAAFGAEVIERYDQNKTGKGYALAYGVRHLAREPPEAVIVIDADCRIASCTIDHLVYACKTTCRPVQALNLMVPPHRGSTELGFDEFAWRVKNWTRPSGLSALGLPCQLMGTGMAFPWKIISSANLGDGELVEDLQLGLDLALAGTPACILSSSTCDQPFSGITQGHSLAAATLGAGSHRHDPSRGPALDLCRG